MVETWNSAKTFQIEILQKENKSSLVYVTSTAYKLLKIFRAAGKITPGLKIKY